MSYSREKGSVPPDTGPSAGEDACDPKICKCLKSWARGEFSFYREE